MSKIISLITLLIASKSLFGQGNSDSLYKVDLFKDSLKCTFYLDSKIWREPYCFTGCTPVLRDTSVHAIIRISIKTVFDEDKNLTKEKMLRAQVNHTFKGMDSSKATYEYDSVGNTLFFKYKDSVKNNSYQFFIFLKGYNNSVLELNYTIFNERDSYPMRFLIKSLAKAEFYKVKVNSHPMGIGVGRRKTK